jgi:hypothetical protein
MVGAFDFRIDNSGVADVIDRLPVAPTCRDEDAIDASTKTLKKGPRHGRRDDEGRLAPASA